MEIINFYKKSGETPLEAVQRFRDDQPKYKNSRLTYAGRLDPLAEGVLLILVDAPENQKKKVLDLPKQYYFEILWGLETDSLDVLGKVKTRNNKFPDAGKLSEALVELKNLKEIPYPVFSSRTVFGKPLWQWAREDRLSEIEIPLGKSEIFSLEKLEDYEISSKDLLQTVEEKISSVRGDFRQEEILDLWKRFLKDSGVFQISCFRAKVGSGTYVRNIADFLGRELGMGAICFKIVREKVGDYGISEL